MDDAHDDDVAALIARVPLGWSDVSYRGRRWGLRRADHAGGKTVTLEAEELGGSGWVSANVMLLSSGAKLAPCEMPAEEVVAFLRGFEVGS